MIGRRVFGARLGYWAALGFVIGYQLIGQPVTWSVPW